MKKPRFLRSLQNRANRTKERARRLERIASLGFEVADRSGWFDGTFASRRYVVKRGDEVFGIYLSSREALHAVEEWAAEHQPHSES